MAARVAERPGGKISEVFTVAAEREAAYRVVENDDVSPQEIAAASHRAAARRSASLPFIYVAVDQTDLPVTDETGTKGFGQIGDSRGSGLQVMSAVAAAPDGTPLGLVGQVYWARPAPPKNRPKKDRRSIDDRESARWRQTIEQSREAFAGAGVTTRRWYQLDRGGDCWPVLLDAVWNEEWVTVRAAYSRRLATEGPDPDYLWPYVERQEPVGCYSLDVAASKARKARSAVLEVRSCAVPLDLALHPEKRHVTISVWAVHVIEVGTTPRGEAPIEWMLLTTFPVATLDDAIQVIVGYSTRWLVEEFHRVWKSGACRVDDMQLRDPAAAERWAVILAAVAMRLLRLMYLSRKRPDLPATSELSPPEITAIIRLHKPKDIAATASPTIADAVRWLAFLGGYTGKSSGGPPGAVVLARGLDYIRSAVQLLSDGEM